MSDTCSPVVALSCPVTALLFDPLWGELLLAGQGSRVLVYHAVSTTLLERLCVGDGSRIHGLKIIHSNESVAAADCHKGNVSLKN